VTVNTTGGTPTITLNDGGTATYTGGSGTNALTFSYTVLQGQNTPDLMETSVNLNGATITDGAGNAANLSLAGVAQGSPQIDTTTPTISSLVESSSSGDLDAGKTVTLTLNLTEAVTVAGGTPTLTLNDGGTAAYTGGSGTGALTFSYTVAAGQNTSALAATAVNLNSATVTDGAGNAANLSLSGLTQSGPQVDTTTPKAPTINSFSPEGDSVTGTSVALTGAAEANSTVVIFDGSTELGSVTANTGGIWSYTAPVLSSGANSLTEVDEDSAGNVSPASAALVVTEAASANLTQVGNNFYLNNTSSDVELKYAGSPFTAGEFGGWTPIGAVQTATGYDVAWRNTASGQYTVWMTNDEGNYTGNLIGAVSGNSYALESIEPVFNQDLNGDGTIGPTGTVIRTDTNALGATSLTEVANQFYLDGSSGSGPTLQYAGAAVTAGEFGGWTPIGAVQTATGYDVAWENTASGQYTVWMTNDEGNYTGNLIGAVSGNSYALESIEPVFDQDLNGDGVIGLYAAPGTALQISNTLSGADGAATIGAGATLEISAADSASITFDASTGMLKIDQPSTFSAEIFGFTGNGTLSGSDQIDLTNIKFGSVQDSYANGVLTIADGSGDTDKLDFNGSYTLANFDFASDDDGGTIVYDPPVLQSSSKNTPGVGACAAPATTRTGAPLEQIATDAQTVTFAGAKGTLLLDDLLGPLPSNFAAKVFGFGGKSVIESPGVAVDAQATLGHPPNNISTSGVQSLNDSYGPNVALLGHYIASSFATAGDNHGGSIIAAMPSEQPLLTNPHHA
jgi:tryptophan-rich protein/Big-like domain-containing protein